MSSAALQAVGQFKIPIGIPDVEKEFCAKLLALYSSNSFDGNTWNIFLASSGKNGTLYFPNQYPKLEVEILKASILDMLSAGATLSTCSGRIHDACFVFDYFESKNLSIVQINQAFFFSFYKYLKTIQFEVWHRNRYLQTLYFID